MLEGEAGQGGQSQTLLGFRSLKSGSPGRNFTINQSSPLPESAVIPKPGRESGTALQLTKFYNTGSLLTSEEDPAAARSPFPTPGSRIRASPGTLGRQQAPLTRQEAS